MGLSSQTFSDRSTAGFRSNHTGGIRSAPKGTGAARSALGVLVLPLSPEGEDWVAGLAATPQWADVS